MRRRGCPRRARRGRERAAVGRAPTTGCAEAGIELDPAEPDSSPQSRRRPAAPSAAIAAHRLAATALLVGARASSQDGRLRRHDVGDRRERPRAGPRWPGAAEPRGASRGRAARCRPKGASNRSGRPRRGARHGSPGPGRRGATVRAARSPGPCRPTAEPIRSASGSVPAASASLLDVQPTKDRLRPGRGQVGAEGRRVEARVRPAPASLTPARVRQGEGAGRVERPGQQSREPRQGNANRQPSSSTKIRDSQRPRRPQPRRRARRQERRGRDDAEGTVEHSAAGAGVEVLSRSPTPSPAGPAPPGRDVAVRVLHRSSPPPGVVAEPLAQLASSPATETALAAAAVVASRPDQAGDR